MKLYHVDRSNNLFEGKVINLFNDYTLTGEYGEEICDRVKLLYTEGISEHGDRYLFDGKYPDWIFECYLENMRLQLFPHCLSRFQSFFALSCEYVDPFLSKLNIHKDSVQIFEIDSENCFPYDMNIIDKLISPGVGVTQYHAYRYWSGDRSECPLIEYLLPLPITIGKKVH